MNLYLSIERDEPLRFVVRAYRDHRLMAEATLPKQVLAELFETPLSSRQCRIVIAANQQALATIIIRKAASGRLPVSLRNDRENRFVDVSVDDLLTSGERFSPGPLQVGPARSGSVLGRQRRAAPVAAPPVPAPPVAAQPVAAE